MKLTPLDVELLAIESGQPIIIDPIAYQLAGFITCTSGTELAILESKAGHRLAMSLRDATYAIKGLYAKHNSSSERMLRRLRLRDDAEALAEEAEMPDV